MEHFHYDHHTRPPPAEDLSTQRITIYVFAGIFLAYQILSHYNISVIELLLSSISFFTPARLVLDQAQRAAAHTWSQTHAAKADSLRNMLGLSNARFASSTALLRQIVPTTVTSTSITADTPAGLGNWDNSCYQNSILQGLASLHALRSYLQQKSTAVDSNSTIAALQEITDKLRDPFQNGKQLWTPARLKSMSSLQQQDAQEYYSKIVDELDKEASRSKLASALLSGCEVVGKQVVHEEALVGKADQNPLEGMLAQQVVCTSCGFSEGLSLIPFNCLTLPLESKPEVTLEDCLAEYTKLEPITGVECAKCTLLKTQQELKRLSAKSESQENAQLKNMLALPPELRAQVMQRLIAVQTALDTDEFSDDTLAKSCQIPKSVRVLSTKTRQALLARMPANLVIHVNRSVFDEMTGSLRKNYAAVRFPASLDVGPWILGSAKQETDEEKLGLPREDLWKYIYRIKAVVTHYGRHENGHYIAYRQAPIYDEEDMLAQVNDLDQTKNRQRKWWRLSDETVSASSEEDVLDQGGVFMLFYERVEEQLHVQSQAEVVPLSVPVAKHTEEQESPVEATATELAAASLPVSTHEVAASEASFTEDESEADVEEVTVRRSSPPSPLLMRTASAAIPAEEHWHVGRFVAAS